MAPRDPSDETGDAPKERDVTARPTGRQPDALRDENDLVPRTNVGGASPTPLGHDSGGDLPGPQDDLANMAEPEPPGSAEIKAVHVEKDPRRRR